MNPNHRDWRVELFSSVRCADTHRAKLISILGTQ